MFLVLLLEFIAFPNKKDSIMKSNIDRVEVAASGSIGYLDGKNCIKTYPNSTLTENMKLDWCSNVGKGDHDKPWITYSIPKNSMKLTGYVLRNGCCYYACCCIDDGSRISNCCCDLYSFSLQGSNDNKTWKTIHKVEKANYFYPCKYETYEFPETEPFRYVRLVQDASYPGCAFCMAVNQIDFYGRIVPSGEFYPENDNENDESVSIIGKVQREAF